MSSNKKIPVSPLPTTTSATKDDFDELVFHASQGDRRAIGALAIAFYPALLAEARAVLAPKGRRHCAEDAVQDFFLSLCEARNRFLPGQGRAIPWMKGIVRAIAQTYGQYGGGRP